MINFKKIYIRKHYIKNYNFLHRSKGVETVIAGSTVGVSVCLSRNLWLCTAAWPRSANFCKKKFKLTRKVRLPIFNQITNVLDLYFQDKTFEWSTLGRLYMIISQTVEGQTLLLPTSIKLQIAFKLEYLHLTLAHSKGQDHVYFNCQYLANSER